MGGGRRSQPSASLVQLADAFSHVSLPLSFQKNLPQAPGALPGDRGAARGRDPPSGPQPRHPNRKSLSAVPTLVGSVLGFTASTSIPGTVWWPRRWPWTSDPRFPDSQISPRDTQRSWDQSLCGPGCAGFGLKLTSPNTLIPAPRSLTRGPRTWSVSDMQPLSSDPASSTPNQAVRSSLPIKTQSAVGPGCAALDLKLVFPSPNSSPAVPNADRPQTSVGPERTVLTLKTVSLITNPKVAAPTPKGPKPGPVSE